MNDSFYTIILAISTLILILVIVKVLYSRKCFQANHVFSIMPFDAHISEQGPLYAKFTGKCAGLSASSCSFTLSDNDIELFNGKGSGKVSNTILVSSIKGVYDWNGCDRNSPVIYILVCVLGGIFLAPFALLAAYRRVKLPCISIITNTGDSFCIAFRNSVFGGIKITRADADRIIRIIERLVYESRQKPQPSFHQDPQPSHSPQYRTSHTNTPYSGSLNR